MCCPRWDPAHPQPLCWVGRGRTGVQRAQSLHTPESWRERRNPGRVQGVLCVEIKGLALPEQQLSLGAHRGRRSSFGEVSNLWAPSAPASPTREETAAAPGTALGREGRRDVALGREGCDSGEPSQVAKGSFPPGHPRAGLELPAAAPDPERGTTLELLSAS